MKHSLALAIIYFFMIIHLHQCLSFRSFQVYSEELPLEDKSIDTESLFDSNSFLQTQEQSQFGKAPAPVVKVKAYDPNRIVQVTDSLKPIVQNWLKISSPKFKNTKLFPPLQLPRSETLKIKIDDGYFRINESHVHNPKNKQGPPEETYFWFRLTERHIYYSPSPEDLHVLGALTFKSIKDVVPLKPYSDEPTCFLIKDTEDSKWKVCAENLKTKRQWVCAIQKLLGIKDIKCASRSFLEEPDLTILTKKVTQPIILIPLPTRMCNEKWDYNQKGDDWECTCKEGKEQSPIDLPIPAKTIHSPVKPVFQYEEVMTKSTVKAADGRVLSDQYIKIILEDGLLKIKNPNFGKVITLNGSIYKAEEIRFHTPAEHKINGKQYDLEMEIIHTGQTKGDIAKYVVLSFLFVKKPGTSNKFIDDVDYFNLPSPTASERDIVNNLYIPKVLYRSDSDDLPVMKPFSFYTYQGSITYPPCSERTIHYVLADPIPLGTAALQLFKEATRIPDMQDADGNVIVNTNNSTNNRNTQPLNGRDVYYYNHVEINGPEPPERPKPKVDGHYEKVNKKMTEYFYVNNAKPSGLPGAFVVSEEEAKGK